MAHCNALVRVPDSFSGDGDDAGAHDASTDADAAAHGEAAPASDAPLEAPQADAPGDTGADASGDTGTDAPACSADLQNDSHNCGACGRVCYGADDAAPASCVGGECAPVDVLTGWPNVFDIALDENVGSGGGFVYYTVYSFYNPPHGGVVGRIPKAAGGTPQVLYTASSQLDSQGKLFDRPKRIVLGPGRMYWTSYNQDAANGSVHWANRDGSAPGLDGWWFQPDSLGTDGYSLFWTEALQPPMQTIPLGALGAAPDGGTLDAPTPLPTGYYTQNLAVDSSPSGYVYLCDGNGLEQQQKVAPYTSLTVASGAAKNCGTPAVDDSFVYYVEGTQLVKRDVGLKNPPVPIVDLGAAADPLKHTVSGMVRDGDYVYAGIYGTSDGSIVRTGTSAGPTLVLASGLKGPNSLKVDAEAIYWTEIDGRIRKLWKDTAAPQCQQCGGTACLDLHSDPLNCGACGHSCLGGGCAGGLCQPVVLAGSVSTYTGLKSLYGLVPAGGYIIGVDWATPTYGALYRARPDAIGASPEFFVPNPSSCPDGSTTQLVTYGPRLYYACAHTNGNTLNSTIYWSNLDGTSGNTVLAYYPGELGYIAVDAQYVYASNLWDSGFHAFDTTTGAVTTTTYGSKSTYLLTDKGYVYYAQGGALMRTPSGQIDSPPQVFGSASVGDAGGGQVDFFDSDGMYIYWLDANALRVFRAPYTGGPTTEVTPKGGLPSTFGRYGFLADSVFNWLYYFDSSIATNGHAPGGAIYRMPKDGSAGGLQTITTSLPDGVSALTQDATSLYWTGYGDDNNGGGPPYAAVYRLAK
jgi:hypothetical protein